MSIFDKIHKILDSIEEGLKTRPDIEEAEQTDKAPEESKKPRAKTAVENAEKAAKLITAHLRSAGYTSSSNPDLRHLEVLVCDDEYGNPQPWGGPDFEKILKDNLETNLMGFFTPEYKRLGSSGKKDGLIEVAPDMIYLRMRGGAGRSGSGVRIALRLMAGTGSSNRELHILDPEVSPEYYIGRGRPTETEADEARIFILEDESNESLKERNSHVSHNQGQIFFDKKKNEWLLMHTPNTSTIKYTTGREMRPSTCYPLSNAGLLRLMPGMYLLLGGGDVTFKVEEAPEKED